MCCCRCCVLVVLWRYVCFRDVWGRVEMFVFFEQSCFVVLFVKVLICSETLGVHLGSIG